MQISHSSASNYFDGSCLWLTTFQPLNSLRWRSWVRHPGLFREPGFRAHRPFGPLPPEFPREVPSAFGSSTSRPGLHMYRYPRTRSVVLWSPVQTGRRWQERRLRRLVLVKAETQRSGPFHWNAASGPVRSWSRYLLQCEVNAERWLFENNSNRESTGHLDTVYANRCRWYRLLIPVSSWSAIRECADLRAGSRLPAHINGHHHGAQSIHAPWVATVSSASRCRRPEYRRGVLFLRIATPSAFPSPTSTTSRLPRVIPV